MDSLQASWGDYSHHRGPTPVLQLQLTILSTYKILELAYLLVIQFGMTGF